MSDTLANALAQAGRSSDFGLATPVVVNPLAGISDAQKLVSGMQTLDKSYAQQQFGRALQQATDANGNVDYPTAIKLASQDPRTAYAMQQGLLDAASLRGSQLNNIAGAQKLFASHMATLQRDPSDANLAAAHADFVAHGGPSPEAEREYARWKAMSEPERVREASRLLVNTPELRGAVVGTTGTQTVGGQVVPTQTVPGLPGYGGPTLSTGRGSVPLGVSTEWLNSPRTYKHPQTGDMVDGTNGTYLTDHGIKPEDVFQGSQTRGGTPGGSTNVDLGNGRRVAVPGALTNRKGGTNPDVNPDTGPVNPPAGSTLRPSTTASPPPPVPTTSTLGTPSRGQQPGDVKVVENDVDTAGSLFANDLKQGDVAVQQHEILGNMQADLGKFTTGSGASRTLDWKRATQSWAPPLAKAFGITPSEIASQEDFAKNVAKLQLAQGSSTDSRLSVIGSSVPHENLSPEGTDLIIRKLQGNADYLQARAKLSREFSGDRRNYRGFQSQIAELDPRVFQIARMDGNQRTEYFKSLTDDAKREILAARQKAKQLGALP